MKAKPTLPHAYLRLGLQNLRRHGWAFGTCGVILMIVHFIRIGYMPALTLPELGLVGGAALLFTVVAAVACLAILIVPGACYESWSSGRLIPRQLLTGKYHRYSRFKLQTRTIRSCLCCKRSLPERTLMQARKGTNWVIAGVSCAGFLMAAATYAAAFNADDRMHSGLFIGIFLAGLLGTIISSTIPNTRLGSVIRKSKTNWKWWLFVFTWALYCAALPMALLIFGSLATDVSATEIDLLLPLLWLPLAHMCVYLTSRMEITARANAIFIIAIYMIIMMGTTTSALDRAASKLRLGLMKNQVVLLTETGCNVVMAAEIVTQCTPVGDDGSMLRAEPVTILTRLGSHVVIAQTGWSARVNNRSVPVKSEDVIAWYPAAPITDKSSKAPTSRGNGQ